jgi:hypothetical protein
MASTREIALFTPVQVRPALFTRAFIASRLEADGHHGCRSVDTSKKRLLA